jgi:hypothetical protein
MYSAAPPPTPPTGPRKVAGLPIWGWLAIAVVLAGGVVGAIVLTSGDDDKAVGPATTISIPEVTTPPQDTTPATITAPEITEPESTEPDQSDTTVQPDDTIGSDTGAEEIAGAPDGTRGTREDPVTAGELADIGGGWRLQVLGFTPDATAEIMAANEFNEPPPAGSTFTMVSLAMGYFGVDDP